jgi:hypothetical protein
VVATNQSGTTFQAEATKRIYSQVSWEKAMAHQIGPTSDQKPENSYPAKHKSLHS